MAPTTGLPTPKVTHDYDTDHGIDDIQVETTTDDGGITTTETHMRVPPGLFYFPIKSSSHLRPEFMVIGLKTIEDGTLNPYWQILLENSFILGNWSCPRNSPIKVKGRVLISTNSRTITFCIK